jgi:acyl-CoA synthetase (AMP-forming)/AMP-acid ligase II
MSAPSPHPLLPEELQAEYRRRGCWEDRTLAEIVQGWAERDPERVAITGPRAFTYEELWRSGRRLAGTLADRVAPGDFVLAVLSNSWQGVAAGVAASIAGVGLAPLSARISPTLALNIFEQVGARGVVLQGALLEREGWDEALAEMRKRAGNGPVLLTEGTFEEAAESGPEIDQRAWDPGRASLVLSTGGTTGLPKSVILYENALVWAAREMAVACEFTESDVHVAFGPYGHASGSLFEIYMPLLLGAQVLPIARWRPVPVAEAIAEYGGTYCITVGTHMFDLLELEEVAVPLLASMRLILSGAGPDHLYEGVEGRFGIPIVRCYGLSECMGHAVSPVHDPPERRLRFDGVVFPDVEYRIADPQTGEPVPQGTPGEYLCRAPSFFMGYMGQPELTQARLTADGLYKTGDLLVEQPGGYLRWEGRIKEIVRRGGLMIDAIEVSDLLSEHPRVAEVIVVGTPDPRLGERAVAVVVPRPGERPGLDDLCAFLIERGLSKEVLPEELFFTDSIPRTEFGEFNRGEVRAWVTTRLEEAQRLASGEPPGSPEPPPPARCRGHSPSAQVRS